MVNIHQPIMLTLLESRMADHQELCEELGFHCHIQSAAVGNSGSLVIMSREDSISIDTVFVSA